ALQSAKTFARLQAELLDQLSSRVLEDAQRVALAAGAVQREHLQFAQVLARGVAGGERLDLHQHQIVAAEFQLGVEKSLLRDQAKLVQTHDRVLREALVGEVGKRCAAPKSERLTKSSRPLRRSESLRRRDQLLEVERVDVLRAHVQHVAGLAKLDQALLVERTAQAPDRVLERCVDGLRRVLPPD